MIICPVCKEEIEEGSHFCDQCGQALLYCNSCGHVGTSRRCTLCGGLMVSADQINQNMQAMMSSISQATRGFVTNIAKNEPIERVPTRINNMVEQPQPQNGIPVITLINLKLNIRIVGINGAILGRRQGPYHDILKQYMYVSGVHAQLIYQHQTGWSIVDKHSSNGTRINNTKLTPDVPTRIKNGDIISIANINLQVNIK